MQGTAESITANINLIRLNSPSGRLIKKLSPIQLDVNISNTSVGGNGACDFGTDSIMTIYPIGLTQTRSLDVTLKNGRTP